MITTKSFHHRLAVAGALVAAFGTALYAALAIPAGDPRAPLFAPFSLVIFGIAFAMSRSVKALRVPLIVGPIVLAIIAIDPLRLLHPDSFIDFVPSVLTVTGTATALFASAIALHERRHGFERGSTRLERASVAAGVTAIVGLAAWSGVATFTRPTTVTLPGGRPAVVVSADENRWVPSRIGIRSAERTVLLIRNPDWIAHKFTSEELGVDIYLGPRSERVIEISVAKPGSYRFHCDVTGHEMMIGAVRAT